MSGAQATQMLKGVLRLLLLELLSEGESYGYEVVLRLRERGLDGAGEGSVYPALSRLEREGLLASKLEASTRGAARKYYRLTADGRAALVEAREAWVVLRDAVESIRTPAESEATDVPA